MTALTALGLSAGTLALLAAGDAIAGLLWPEREGTHLARLARAWLLGAGAVSLALLVLLRLGVPLAWGVLALTLAATGARLASAPRTARGRNGEPRPRDPFALLFAALLAMEVAQTAAAALLPPLTAWDSWVTWWSKAAGIAHDQALSAALLAGPDRLPTNASYPLLVPLTESWLLTFAPGAGERAAGWAALLFHAALLALLADLLARFVTRRAALGFTLLFAASPRVFRFAPLAMADLPLAAMVLLAFDALEEEGGRAPLAVGVCGGLLPWTKTEGWLWLGILAALLAARRGARALRLFAPLALVIASLWPLARLGWPSHPYVFGRAPRLERTPEILLALVRCLLRPEWSFVWPLAALVALFSVRRLRAAERGLLLAPAAFLLAASAAFLFSRFDPWDRHLANSVDRLALQSFPLAVAGLAAAGARGGLWEEAA